MKLQNKILIGILIVCIPFIVIGLINTSDQDPNKIIYDNHCLACHGKDLQGTPQGPSLLREVLTYGNAVPDLMSIITQGSLVKGMPAFANTLTETQIRGVSIYISETREGKSMTDFNIENPLVILTEVISTELLDVRIETVIKDIHPWPYSIAPLPDGSILLTEKTRGLSIISPEGKQSALIKGIPKIYDDGTHDPGHGLLYGLGWLLDVTLDPEYEKNGWIYLSFNERCTACNEVSRATGLDVSMTKLIRGRIKGGKWVDQQTIWSTDTANYTYTPENSSGGRICFDEEGHVFLSVGARLYSPDPPGFYEAYLGIQDLSLPYGKIYRLNTDGSIPDDNPFFNDPNALPSIWTYGHRSPQGLEYDTSTNKLWGTEMGPRGGDEINLLEPGKNYGWPLYSKGINYDGSPIAYGDVLGIELNLEDIEQPIIDLTPSPAVSSMIIYHGDTYPGWEGNLIVGTLKASELHRYVIEDGSVIHREIVLTDLARIRDIEIGPDGFIYLLLEHRSGGLIVKLVPER